MKNKLGIIGAMDIEVETLKSALSDCKTTRVAEMEFYEGKLSDKEVIVVKCGIGKVNAARCVQILADKFDVDAVVNTGIGGGIGDGLKVADIVIGDELVQHDKNKTPIIPFNERCAIVEAIKYVDKVVPQVDKNKLGAWEIYKFDKMFVGSDWQGTDAWNKFEEQFADIGVEIVYLSHTDGISSTILREKLNGEQK